MIVAAVPVKDLVNAKQRLTDVLLPAQRAALARAMLNDVLRALSGSRVDAVWVVTRDAEVAALARGFGCEIVAEDENRGHTAAVKRAQAAAANAGARIFLTVPGDVPCVTAAEIDALAAAPAGAGTIGVAFTPSRSGFGTNGAALLPPEAMGLTFGEPSFENHLAAARRAGLTPRVIPLRGLSLDIDDRSDLVALLAEGSDTESARLVATWSGAGRLPVVSRR